MGRVLWKESKVVSIETMNGIYVLAQMLKSPYLLVTNIFGSDNEWEISELMDRNFLFVKAVTSQFLKYSNITYQKNIKPIDEPVLPRLWIKSSPKAYMATIWKGTDDEMEFIMIGEGGGSLIEKDITRTGRSIETVIAQSIDEKDCEIDNYEMTDLAIYPNFNERLFLCYRLGKNVSPDKDLIFNKPLPKEYTTYFEMLSGKWAKSRME